MKSSVIVVDQNEDVGGDASKSTAPLFILATMPPGTLESQLVVAAQSNV